MLGRIFTRVKDFKKHINETPKRLELSGMRLAREIKDDFINIVTPRAPYNTGQLRNSITAKKQRYGYVITATRKSERTSFNVAQYTDKKVQVIVPTTDRSFFNIIRGVSSGKRNPFFAPGQSFFYGDLNARSVSGKPIKWTGNYPGGWWTFTEKHINEVYKPEIAGKKILARSLR